MNIIIQYGTGVAALPREVLRVMDRATMTDLKLLLLLASEPSLLVGDSLTGCAEGLAAAGGCTPAQAESSLAFWRGAGVILLQGEEAEILREPPKDAPQPSSAVAEGVDSSNTSARPNVTVKKPLPENTLPRYTSEELADLLEARAEARTSLDECANIWGKEFNIPEVNIFMGLVDYLGLDWDYVITLLAFCAKAQDGQGRKRSLRYFEKTAYELYDEGVVNLSLLQEKLRRLESLQETEGVLRRMLGIGERVLTANEKKIFSKWLYDFGYGIDIITMAFETTVEVRGSYNLKYMDAVLTNWHNAGLTTPAAITAHNEQYRAEHTPPAGRSKASAGKNPTTTGSFDTDDFFYDAVRSSLGEDFDIEELKKTDKR
jgi:DnaD/phage-associated family protein